MAAHFHEAIVLGVKCCERGNMGRVKKPRYSNSAMPKTVKFSGPDASH